MCKDFKVNLPAKTAEQSLKTEDNSANNPVKLNFEKKNDSTKKDNPFDYLSAIDLNSENLFKFHLESKKALEDLSKNACTFHSDPSEVDFDNVFDYKKINSFITNLSSKSADEFKNLNEQTSCNNDINASEIQQIGFIGGSENINLINDLLHKIQKDPSYKPSFHELLKVGKLSEKIKELSEQGKLNISKEQMTLINKYVDLSDKLDKNAHEISLKRDIRNMSILQSVQKAKEIYNLVKTLPDDNAMKNLLLKVLEKYDEIQSTSPATATLYNDFLEKIINVIDDDLPPEKKAEMITEEMNNFSGLDKDGNLTDSSILGKIDKIQKDSSLTSSEKKAELLKVITEYVGSTFKSNAFIDLIYNEPPEKSNQTLLATSNTESAATKASAFSFKSNIKLETFKSTSDNEFTLNTSSDSTEIFSIKAIKTDTRFEISALGKKPRDIEIARKVIIKPARAFIKSLHAYRQTSQQIERLKVIRHEILNKMEELIKQSPILQVLDDITVNFKKYDNLAHERKEAQEKVSQTYDNLIKEIMERADSLEANLNMFINPCSEYLVSLFEKFRSIIVELELDTQELNNKVSERNKIDFSFSKQLKENRERWDTLDKIKAEMEFFFKKSKEINKSIEFNENKKLDLSQNILNISKMINNFV